ncbi:MAG: sulfatase-like hydrolase/transferase [Abditibacteriales bacterium]|nr:sulfatase-like hydrolase/transferase [Abditibacteriales bacterium]MDW8364265.1 sulfatase-like hydrolase/transferase [Abditibacteriales bacterium]
MWNVILIVIDDLRFDCLGCESEKSWLRRYDAARFVCTPTLDALAAAGVRFRQCMSTSSYTPAAHASLLTGVYPPRHAVRTFFGSLAAEVTTLAEILAAHGYRTFGRVEHAALPTLDLTRGIAHLDVATRDEQMVWEQVRRAQQEGEKIFLFLHCFDVHKPYYYATGSAERHAYNADYLPTVLDIAERAGLSRETLLGRAEREARRVVPHFDSLPESLREFAVMRSLDFLLRERLRTQGRLFEEMVPLYVRGVAKFDQGKLRDILNNLRAWGVLEDALLVVTSDHGESRCSWNGKEDFMNQFDLLETSIRVPLIFHAPHVLPAGGVVEAPVSLVDIVPTVLDLLGIAYDLSAFDGRSLRPLLHGEGADFAERPLFAETWAYRGGVDHFGNRPAQHEAFCRQRAVRVGDHKYVVTGGVDTPDEALDDAAFVRALFRDVLGVFEEEGEVARWTAALQRGEVTRDGLRADFRERARRLGIAEMLFDLRHDPYGERDLIGEPRYAALRVRLREHLARYLHAERAAQEVGAQEQQQLRQHLKALGYL